MKSLIDVLQYRKEGQMCTHII